MEEITFWVWNWPQLFLYFMFGCMTKTTCHTENLLNLYEFAFGGTSLILLLEYIWCDSIKLYVFKLLLKLNMFWSCEDFPLKKNQNFRGSCYMLWAEIRVSNACKNWFFFPQQKFVVGHYEYIWKFCIVVCFELG